jgi:hypothetical protein
MQQQPDFIAHRELERELCNQHSPAAPSTVPFANYNGRNGRHLSPAILTVLQRRRTEGHDPGAKAAAINSASVGLERCLGATLT